MTAEAVLEFWFEELGSKGWFARRKRTDSTIQERFGLLHEQATMGELYEWRSEPEGALAEIIVLDQFSRNLYRDSPKAFATDAQSLTLAQFMVASGQDQRLPIERRGFAYMPYMHSESAVMHKLALEFFSQPGLESHLRSERNHKSIIDRFGRYPHRNETLGRRSSDREVEFLATPGSKKF